MKKAAEEEAAAEKKADDLEARRLKAKNCKKEEYQIRSCLRLYVFNVYSIIFLTMILIFMVYLHVMTHSY